MPRLGVAQRDRAGDRILSVEAGDAQRHRLCSLLSTASTRTHDVPIVSALTIGVVTTTGVATAAVPGDGIPQDFHRPSPPFAFLQSPPTIMGAHGNAPPRDSFQSPTRRLHPPPIPGTEAQQQCPIVVEQHLLASTLVAGQSARPRTRPPLH